jgi:predicted acylesterase/phospholipase RssA
MLPLLEASDMPISVIVGSSIGSVNGLVLAAGLSESLPHAVNLLHDMWIERTYRNTFAGSPTRAFVRAIRIAINQALKPGPSTSATSVFDPKPLVDRVDQVVREHGGLSPEKRNQALHSVAVMTTVDGAERKPLLFLSSKKKIDGEYMQGASFEIKNVPELTARHGFASAALPSILPPVELDENDSVRVRLLDGGISQNTPVDPAVRLGAEEIIVIDISGRLWWFDRYKEPHDTRPSWEVPAKDYTFCFRPPHILTVREKTPMGTILKQCVGKSTSKFISAVGPVWPLFSLLRNKLGDEAAYEAMSYVALDREFLQGIIELGYHETKRQLDSQSGTLFSLSAPKKPAAQAPVQP